MCMECLQHPCHPRCPNYVAKVVGNCSCCNDEIEDGQEVYSINGEWFCEDCVSTFADNFYAEDYDATETHRCYCCGEKINDGDEVREISFKNKIALVHDECVDEEVAEAEDYCDW